MKSDIKEIRRVIDRMPKQGRGMSKMKIVLRVIHKELEEMDERLTSQDLYLKNIVEVMNEIDKKISAVEADNGQVITSEMDLDLRKLKDDLPVGGVISVDGHELLPDETVASVIEKLEKETSDELLDKLLKDAGEEGKDSEE